MRQTPIRIVVFTAILLLALGCTKVAQKIPVRIGYVPYSSCTPLFYALETGLFDKAKLPIQALKFQTANEVMNALVQGDIDCIGGIGFPTYFAVEQNTQGQFQVLWCAVESENRFVNMLLTRADSPISSIKDLRGHRVGTFTGSTQLMNIKAILSRVMDPSRDVELLQVSPQLQIQALATGQFDALFTIEPIPTIAIHEGIAKPLLENPRCKYIMSPFPAGAGVVSTRFLKLHPTESSLLAACFDQAIDSIRLYENKAKSFLPKYTPIDSAVALDSRLYDWWKSGEMKAKCVQQLADTLTSWGELDRHVDVTAMFAPAGEK